MVPFCSIPLESCYFQWCQTAPRPLTTTEGFNLLSIQPCIGHLNRLACLSRGESFWSTTGGGQVEAPKALLAGFCPHMLTQKWEKPFSSWGTAGLCALLSDSSFGGYVGAAHKGHNGSMVMVPAGQNWGLEKLLTLYSCYLADAHCCLLCQTGLGANWWPRVIQPLSWRSIWLKWNGVTPSISL